MKLSHLIISLLLALPLSAQDDEKNWNTVCPIMVEDQVDHEEYYKVEGIEVLLCCTKCTKLFKENPKYYVKVGLELDLLPQFIGMEKKLKLDEVELLDQRFCPIYEDSVITPDSPSLEHDGRKIYFFKIRAKEEFEMDLASNFKKARTAGLLPQYDKKKEAAKPKAKGEAKGEKKPAKEPEKKKSGDSDPFENAGTELVIPTKIVLTG